MLGNVGGEFKWKIRMQKGLWLLHSCKIKSLQWLWESQELQCDIRRWFHHVFSAAFSHTNTTLLTQEGYCSLTWWRSEDEEQFVCGSLVLKQQKKTSAVGKDVDGIDGRASGQTFLNLNHVSWLWWSSVSLTCRKMRFWSGTCKETSNALPEGLPPLPPRCSPSAVKPLMAV